jgi:hypothetical protein
MERTNVVSAADAESADAEVEAVASGSLAHADTARSMPSVNPAKIRAGTEGPFGERQP